MTSLAEKEAAEGQGPDDLLRPALRHQVRLELAGQHPQARREGRQGRRCTRQPEQIKAFRDTWELGIHSYLTYLRDRLAVARDLLTESGSIFVQIGDENVHLVRCVLDEVFGSENFIAHIVFEKKTGRSAAELLRTVCDYLLWYAQRSSST